MIVPECRPLWHGIERADSLVINPHRWLGVGFDCSAYYCRDPQHLIRVMGNNLAVLRTQHDGQVTNFRDWHIQLAEHARRQAVSPGLDRRRAYRARTSRPRGAVAAAV